MHPLLTIGGILNISSSYAIVSLFRLNGDGLIVNHIFIVVTYNNNPHFTSLHH